MSVASVRPRPASVLRVKNDVASGAAGAVVVGDRARRFARVDVRGVLPQRPGQRGKTFDAYLEQLPEAFRTGHRRRPDVPRRLPVEPAVQLGQHGSSSSCTTIGAGARAIAGEEEAGVARHGAVDAAPARDRAPGDKALSMGPAAGGTFLPRGGPVRRARPARSTVRHARAGGLTSWDRPRAPGRLVAIAFGHDRAHDRRGQRAGGRSRSASRRRGRRGGPMVTSSGRWARGGAGARPVAAAVAVPLVRRSAAGGNRRHGPAERRRPRRDHGGVAYAIAHVAFLRRDLRDLNTCVSRASAPEGRESRRREQPRPRGLPRSAPTASTRSSGKRGPMSCSPKGTPFGAPRRHPHRRVAGDVRRRRVVGGGVE